MGKMNSDNFITRNGFVTISAAESIPVNNVQLSLPQLHNFIVTNELDADDFYININNQEKPFCYYRGTVFLEFNDLSNLKQRIITIENQLNQALANRDFARFFKIVDPRLAPDLFMEVFSFIPDQEKYPLFIHIFNDNRYGRNVFSPEFIRQVSRYKGANEIMPLADEWGYVKIFAWANKIAELENCDIWYTDINIAIQKMISAGMSAEFFQALVNVRDIKSYNAKIFEKKVTLDPLQVIKTNHMDMIKISELRPLMLKQGLTGRYFYYAQQIKTDWFHNPQGIHALSHTKRVLLLGLLLTHLEQLSDQDRDLICQAAIYHDIGRITDGYDTSHGVASYRKLVAKGLLKGIPDAQRESLRFIIELHAVADRAALKQLNKYGLTDIDRTLRLYNIFKDADGLDRVRINDLNPDYLRSPGAHKLLLLAHQLFRDPEYELLLGN